MVDFEFKKVFVRKRYLEIIRVFMVSLFCVWGQQLREYFLGFDINFFVLFCDKFFKNFDFLVYKSSFKIIYSVRKIVSNIIWMCLLVLKDNIV